MVAAKGTLADHERRIEATEKGLEAFIKEMRDAMTYRLPLWATFTLSGLTGIIGWLLASK
jgi:hypothetical protein